MIKVMLAVWWIIADTNTRHPSEATLICTKSSKGQLVILSWRFLKCY